MKIKLVFAVASEPTAGAGTPVEQKWVSRWNIRRVWYVGGVTQAVVVACVLCCRAVAYEGIDTRAYGAGRAGDPDLTFL